MSIFRRRSLAILLFVTFAYTWFNALAGIANQVNARPIFNQENLQPNQADLRDAFIASKLANLPRELTIQETGSRVYRLADGTLSYDPPNWYQNGVVILSRAEWGNIAELSVMETPDWVFWKDSMIGKEYIDLVTVLSITTLFGIVSGVIFAHASAPGYQSGAKLGFMAGLGISVLCGTASRIITLGVISLLAYLLVFAFVFTQTNLIMQLWKADSQTKVAQAQT